MKETICLRFDAETIRHLKQLAWQESDNGRQDISYVDLIRIAVDRVYPQCRKSDDGGTRVIELHNDEKRQQ